MSYGKCIVLPDTVFDSSCEVGMYRSHYFISFYFFYRPLRIFYIGTWKSYLQDLVAVMTHFSSRFIFPSMIIVLLEERKFAMNAIRRIFSIKV